MTNTLENFLLAAVVIFALAYFVSIPLGSIKTQRPYSPSSRHQPRFNSTWFD